MEPSDQPSKLDSGNACCDEWKKKCSKSHQARNALRQAVQVLDQKLNEVQTENKNLKIAWEEERIRAKIETEEKLKEYNARVSLEAEICSLKSDIAAIQQKHGDGACDGKEKVEGLQACIADQEKEISRLKELLEEEKRRADKEMKNAEKEKKKASEARKLVEMEKKKTAEKEMQIAKIEAGKAEECRTQLGKLEKEVSESKMKLASQISALKEATKKFEAEKRKILAEKRNAESGMAKAKEMLEIEKQKVAGEKRRADAEMVNLEEQKALAENNWRKFMEQKCLVDQMSQQIEEDKRTIEDLKQKISELSSLRKPIERAGVSTDFGVKAESTDVKLLKTQLKLEKLRTKYAKQKFKLEASHHSILRNELGQLKTDSIQLLRRLDVLDASFSPFSGKRDETKSENVLYTHNSDVTRQECTLDLSQMHGQLENELPRTCCRKIDACDCLRKNMQRTPLLDSCGRNYSESIPGIDSKLQPLIRGSSRTKLQSSAINSSSESFSHGKLMGSQETTAFPVSASAKLDQEIFNARQSMSNSSDRFVTEHNRKRKQMHDETECNANLSSENLSNFHGLLHSKEGKCLEGRKEMMHSLNGVQQKDGRAHKKRKKSLGKKVVMVPQIGRDVKNSLEKTNAVVHEDANVCIQTPCPGSFNLETPHSRGERICDAPNTFDSIIGFDKVTDGNYMKLLELDNAADEQRYIRAMNCPLSPSLPEIKCQETFDADTLKKPFLEEAFQEDILSQRTDLFPSTHLDVINSKINSSGQNNDVSGVLCDSQNKPTQSSKTENVKLPHMHTQETSRASCLVEDELGHIHNQVPKFCVVSSYTKDSSIISRILVTTKACIAQCSLAMQTTWAVGSILTAIKMEETLLPKEKVSVLFTLMLFNFVMTTWKSGKLPDGNIFHCLNSYAEHVRTVMSDAEIRILFSEIYSLPDLLGVIEDFLIEGKVLVPNTVSAETLSDCLSDFSSDIASSEQLLAGSVILASVCAATDHVGFIFEASYDILRVCKWDSLMVLTILHIFAYLGGEKLFQLDNFGLMETVLKSLVIFLEGESPSVATTSHLHSIDQIHTEFCMNHNRKCLFLDGAESIDTVGSLLVEEIKNCCLQGIEQVSLSDSRIMSDTYNAKQCSNAEAVQNAIKNCGAACCFKNCRVSATQSSVLRNGSFCRLSDVLSLLELVANKMSWHWSNVKLVPQLLNTLDSCVEENLSIAIVVLLGQFGRIGVDAGGYEDRGVQDLRCNLLAYLDRISSKKAAISLQISTATALFGLLPLDHETFLHTDISLQPFSGSVSENAKTLKKWFSGLDKDEQKLLSNILRPH